jgi:3-dehydroquinate dehydratase-1
MVELIELAHKHGVYAMPSYHNFRGTPSVEWMVGLMEHMWDLGADIAKCATMAKNYGDALRLMQATYECAELHANGPMLTMAMGREGSISRLAGEYYGNAITLCALRDASAPGQVAVAQARRIMDDLHEVLS